MTRWILLALLSACNPKPSDDTGHSGDPQPCEDGDGDGVCDGDDACEGADDAQDQDGDGVPDSCEIDWLAIMETSQNFMDTTSTRIGVQLAYDTHLATSQWVIFTPPLELAPDAPLATAWTRELSDWQGVQERLTDGVDENFCTYVTGLEDDFHQALTLREDYYDLSGLEGAVINQVELEARDWEFDEEPQTAVFRWTFYGTVPQ